ncbi:hypothetical protein GW17_00030173 [Ensete ventricosum]|nr:hypothetical protein GW17_00030173 [Ensete ventricosum]
MIAGGKRTFGDLDEEEDDVFGPKKGKPKVEESGPAFFEIILHLYQEELEAAKSEIQKWHSAFQNGPATPAGTSPGLYLLHNKFVPWVKN